MQTQQTAIESIFGIWREAWVEIDDENNGLSDDQRDALMDKASALEVTAGHLPATTFEDLNRKIAMVLPNPEFCDEVRHREATAALVREARRFIGLPETGQRV